MIIPARNPRNSKAPDWTNSKNATKSNLKHGVQSLELKPALDEVLKGEMEMFVGKKCEESGMIIWF